MNKKASPKSVPDIQWGDFGISFYEGREKKLTEKQKDDIVRFIKFTIMEDMEAEEKAKENKDKK